MNTKNLATLETLKASFTEEEAKAFEVLLEDYNNSAFRVLGRFFCNAAVIADLVKTGWRKAPFIIKPTSNIDGRIRV